MKSTLKNHEKEEGNSFLGSKEEGDEPNNPTKTGKNHPIENLENACRPNAPLERRKMHVDQMPRPNTHCRTPGGSETGMPMPVGTGGSTCFRGTTSFRPRRDGNRCSGSQGLGANPLLHPGNSFSRQRAARILLLSHSRVCVCVCVCVFLRSSSKVKAVPHSASSYSHSHSQILGVDPAGVCVCVCVCVCVRVVRLIAL